MKLQQLQEVKYDVKPNKKNLLRFKHHMKELTKGSFSSASRTAYSVISELSPEELIGVLSQQFGPPIEVKDPDYEYPLPTIHKWEVYFGTITAEIWDEDLFSMVTYNHTPAS